MIIVTFFRVIDVPVIQIFQKSSKDCILECFKCFLRENATFCSRILNSEECVTRTIKNIL